MMSEANEMIQCPYNTAHLILKHRMAAHLVKCRQQHPSEKFETCPFNSTHDVPAPELQYHVGTCPDRRQLENYIYIIGDPEPEEPVKPTPIEIPPSEENWDEVNRKFKSFKTAEKLKSEYTSLEGSTSASYLDTRSNALENQMVFRQPVGMSKTSRKEFLKNEVQRFGNFSN